MRGPKKMTEQVIERYRKEGRGMGEGANYKPWINVGEFSSSGRTHRIHSLKTGREHQLFSDVERDLFFLLEWSAGVIDIREQFPLDRAITLEIAASAGIRHPTYPGTHIPTVMTIDFLVTKAHRGKKILYGFDGKTSQEAENERSLEKLEIHRRFLDGMGFQHIIVLNTTIPTQKVRNIAWIRDAYIKPGEVEPYENYFDDKAQRMASQLAGYQGNTTLQIFCERFDIQHGLESGTGLRVARLLMQLRVLIPDLSQPDLPTCPLAAFKVAAFPGHLRLVEG